MEKRGTAAGERWPLTSTSAPTTASAGCLVLWCGGDGRPKRVGHWGELGHLPCTVFVLHRHHVLVGVGTVEEREGDLVLDAQGGYAVVGERVGAGRCGTAQERRKDGPAAPRSSLGCSGEHFELTASWGCQVGAYSRPFAFSASLQEPGERMIRPLRFGWAGFLSEIGDAVVPFGDAKACRATARVAGGRGSRSRQGWLGRAGRFAGRDRWIARRGSHVDGSACGTRPAAAAARDQAGGHQYDPECARYMACPVHDPRGFGSSRCSRLDFGYGVRVGVPLRLLFLLALCLLFLVLCLVQFVTCIGVDRCISAPF